MNGNDKSIDRNWYTADRATLVTGSDWARWELHWADGAMVYGVEDTAEAARAALRRYGFNA